MMIRILSIFILFACLPFHASPLFSAPQLPGITEEELTLPPDVKVSIMRPAARPSGNILVLPGWKHSRKRLPSETDLSVNALKRGYVLILPEMGVTLYESEYFPETTMKWNPVPGGRWILENLIPFLQGMDLFRPGQRNFILGYSTGGRGAALISLNRPDLITGAASIAGDFNQAAMPRDRLMTAVYGPSGSFPERWKGRDNPSARISEWKTPFFAAHAMDDPVVPFSQSSEFIKLIRARNESLNGKIPVVFLDPLKGGHDYPFVRTAVGPALDFFDSIR